MFQDLDTTLQAILDDATAPTTLRDADVSFETPDKNYTPSQGTVNLFLYEVKENRELRDPEPVLQVENGQYTRSLPPLRIDCSYLVTAWSNQNGALKAAEEHQLLGLALAWLSRFDTIPDTYFSGALVDPPYAPPTMVAQMDGKQSISEFWSALGIAPRPAFTATVTIAMDLEGVAEVGPEVIAQEVRFGRVDGDGEQERLFAIAGTVRNSTDNAAIQGATVTLQELGWSTQTDDRGRFRHLWLAAGNYTLQTGASGFTAATTSITVPNQVAGAYDVSLSNP